MEFTSLWVDASRDVEADNRLRALTSARVQIAGVWPFLAAATDQADFANRLMLAQDRIMAAAADAGVPSLDLVASLEQDFLGLHAKAAYYVESADGTKVGGPYDDHTSAKKAIDGGDVTGDGLKIAKGDDDDADDDDKDDDADDKDDDAEDKGDNPFGKSKDDDEDDDEGDDDDSPKNKDDDKKDDKKKGNPFGKKKSSLTAQGSHEPVGYSYEADTHCPGCAEDRFGRSKRGFIGEDKHDDEGNDVHPIAPWDETHPHGENCGTCGGEIAEPYDHHPDACGEDGCSGVTKDGQVLKYPGDQPSRHEGSLFPVVALEEGEDPLAWVPETVPPEPGTPEKPDEHTDHFTQGSLLARFASLLTQHGA